MNHQPSLDNPHIQQPLFSFTTSHSGGKKPSCHRLQSLSYSLMHLPNPTERGCSPNWVCLNMARSPSGFTSFKKATRIIKYSQNLWFSQRTWAKCFTWLSSHGVLSWLSCESWVPYGFGCVPRQSKICMIPAFHQEAQFFFKRTSYENHLANVFWSTGKKRRNKSTTLRGLKQKACPYLNRTKSLSSWWFQPMWKILVRLDHFCR